MKHMFGAAIALGLGLLGQGCAGIPYQTYDLVDDIAEDQQSLNDAYGRALNGQILLNVLRSRDRWPRHYTNVNPMTDQPTVQSSGSLRLSPLSLGGANSPFAGSSGEVSHAESTRPSYGVTGLDSEAINRAVLSPTKRSVFAHYWNSGWPRDLLLLVMAASITRDRATPSPQGRPARRDWGAPLANTARQLDGGCTPLAQETGAATWRADPTGDCAFFQLAHRLADFSGGAGRGRIRLGSAPDPNCERSTPVTVNAGNADLIAGLASLSEVAGNKLTVRLHDPNPNATAAARRNGDQPEARREIQVVSCTSEDAAPIILEVMPTDSVDVSGTPARPLATYYLELRSLDAMVYAMGEVLRRGHGTVNGRVVANGQTPLVRGPCDAQPCPLTPLFRVMLGPVERDEDYAAVIVHRGQRYFAGPAVGDFIVPRTPEGNWDESQLDRMQGDRTATVLTLLTQLFALNNSPGALAAPPPRPVID